MQKIVRSLTAEFLGTFLFAFIAVGVVVVDASRGGQLGLPGIAIAQGLAFAIAVTATLSISGGHINPAVTFGLWLAKKIDGKLGALYVLAQLLAAVLAVVCVRFLLPEVAGEVTNWGTPRISGILTDVQAVAIEAILTLFLVSAVFGTIVAADAPKVGGFAVGLVVLCNVLVGGTLTGAAMNPARAFGPALIAGEWQGHLIFWVGPILGAAVAAAIWGWVLLPTEDPEPGAPEA
jgi:MIP family channel proteins